MSRKTGIGWTATKEKKNLGELVEVFQKADDAPHGEGLEARIYMDDPPRVVIEGEMRGLARKILASAVANPVDELDGLTEIAWEWFSEHEVWTVAVEDTTGEHWIYFEKGRDQLRDALSHGAVIRAIALISEDGIELIETAVGYRAWFLEEITTADTPMTTIQ